MERGAFFSSQDLVTSAGLLDVLAEGVKRIQSSVLAAVCADELNNTVSVSVDDAVRKVNRTSGFLMCDFLSLFTFYFYDSASNSAMALTGFCFMKVKFVHFSVVYLFLFLSSPSFSTPFIFFCSLFLHSVTSLFKIRLNVLS